jgi:tRNA (mo5U34)-methyltransferase
MTLQSNGRSVAADAIGRQITSLAPWFHNLHLPSGHQTAPDHPLGDFPAFKWAAMSPHLPSDMTGLRVLDIGCNAGFYSFQLAARGAQVLAFDSDEHYLAQARWAAEHLDPERRIAFRRMHVYDLADIGERFDIVLFLGVLYHLRYPLLALDLVAERTAGTLVLQTMTMPASEQDEPPADLPLGRRAALASGRWPRAAFIERRLAGDPTNWWVPDDACVRAMARSSGLRIVAAPAHEIYVCRRDERRSETTPLRLDEMRAATQRRPAPAAGGPRPRLNGRRTEPEERYEVRRGAIPRELIDDALRVLHLDLLTRGAPAEELAGWLWGAHWFPHLRDHEAFAALADACPAEWRTGIRCETQILLQFPHVGPKPPITFHVDHEPEWAAGRYVRIVGVPLSSWRRENGGLLVEQHGEQIAVEIDAGDVVMMTPGLRHTGGINTTGAIRYAVYFRWLREG